MVVIYKPKLLSNEWDASEIEADIFVSFEKDGDPNVAARAMYDFFAERKFSVESIAPYLRTYWRWFTRIVWLYTHRLDVDMVPEYMRRTLTTAVSMELSYLETYINFLSDQINDAGHVVQIHRIICDALSSSVAPLSYSDSKSITEAQVVEWIKTDFSRMSDLDRAENIAKIQMYLFEKNDVAVGPLPGTSTQLTANYLDFLRFLFKTVDPNTTVKRFQQVRAQQSELPINEQVEGAVLLHDTLIAMGKEPVSIAALLRPFNIFEYFDTFIKKDDGVYPLDKVLTELNDMADVREEPRIRDVYYYNESTGQFEWDEALLKELELVPSDFDMSTIHT